MAFTRDTVKKLYQSKFNYPDGMKQIANKFLWNRVLNKFPRLAEFFLTGRGKNELTTLERSMSEFIIQSEFIKPYTPGNYTDKEYEYPPHNGIPYWGPGPAEVIIDPDPPPEAEITEPGEYVCAARLVEGCWCENDPEGQRFVIFGTYPIVGLQVTFGDAAISNVEGYYTQRVEGIIGGGRENVGMVTIEVFMITPIGICDSNVNVFECSDSICCDIELECHEDNPETMSGSSETDIAFIGGRPGFAVSISGEGFWLDAGYTITEHEMGTGSRVTRIYTDPTCCGIGVLSITDHCDNNASCTIRCTNGIWVYQGVAPCECPGPADGASNGWCGSGAVCNHIDGDCKQTAAYGQLLGCFGFCNCNTTDCTQCNAQNGLGGYGECIPFGDCNPPQISGGSGASICCYYPCEDPEQERQEWSIHQCYGYQAGYPYWWHWECP